MVPMMGFLFSTVELNRESRALAQLQQIQALIKLDPISPPVEMKDEAGKATLTVATTGLSLGHQHNKVIEFTYTVQSDTMRVSENSWYTQKSKGTNNSNHFEYPIEAFVSATRLGNIIRIDLDQRLTDLNANQLRNDSLGLRVYGLNFDFITPDAPESGTRVRRAQAPVDFGQPRRFDRVNSFGNVVSSHFRTHDTGWRRSDERDRAMMILPASNLGKAVGQLRKAIEDAQESLKRREQAEIVRRSNELPIAQGAALALGVLSVFALAGGIWAGSSTGYVSGWKEGVEKQAQAVLSAQGKTSYVLSTKPGLKTISSRKEIG